MSGSFHDAPTRTNLRTRQPLTVIRRAYDLTPVSPPLRTDCPSCGQHRLSAAHLASDPTGWARAETERMAVAWLGSHPCRRMASFGTHTTP